VAVSGNPDFAGCGYACPFFQVRLGFHFRHFLLHNLILAAMPCRFGFAYFDIKRRKIKKIVEKLNLGAKLAIMNIKTTSSKIAKKVQAGIAACLLPMFFLYVLLDKPDYKIMNSMAGFVVPVAHVVGDGITWPVRVAKTINKNMLVRHGIRNENRELRKKLDELTLKQTSCITLIAENQRLEQSLDIVRSQPQRAVLSRIVYENTSFSSNTFTLDKGENAGIRKNNTVLSKNGFLLGAITSVGPNWAQVRGIRDAGANTPVRVAGSDVLGFLRGRGNALPVFELFSDQEFSPTKGIMLISVSAGGNLPDGVPIGKIETAGNGKSVPVSLGAKTMSEAIVLIQK
jgi:cell shape-determining protein MreC